MSYMQNVSFKNRYTKFGKFGHQIGVIKSVFEKTQFSMKLYPLKTYQGEIDVKSSGHCQLRIQNI